MNTIDSLLHFVFLEAMTTSTPFSSRDNKTLRSLHTAMQSDTYITQKQGNLLIQILSNPVYETFMLLANADYNAYLDKPQWQKSFRILPDVKKIFYISADSKLIPSFSRGDDENYFGFIGIEFTFSSSFRKLLNEQPNIIQIKSGSFYIADLTETNIVSVINLLKEYSFEIDTVLQDYYNTITAWDEQTVIEQYAITNIPNASFQHVLINDIGENTPLDSLIINDRRHRYQYTTKVPSDTESLTAVIANRASTKLWLDNTKYNLTDIVKSLVELKRFPLLVVFDQATDLNTIAQFNKISHALNENNINNDIGIYFRLDNTPDGKIFNDAIANRQYNCKLEKSTQVAGVRAGKLPKFFLQSDWKPMSVISINNSLRQSKTAVYAKCCDLVISYTHIEPIIETRNTWE